MNLGMYHIDCYRIIWLMHNYLFLCSPNNSCVWPEQLIMIENIPKPSKIIPHQKGCPLVTQILLTQKGVTALAKESMTPLT